MFQKEVLEQILEPASQFELEDLAGSYEEEDACET